MKHIDDTIEERAKPRVHGPPDEPAGEELRLARERLTAEFDGAIASFRRSLYIEKRALGLKIFDTGYRAASFAAATIAGFVVALAATLLAVASLRRGLHLWTGDAWWSDLALAGGLLSLLVVIAHSIRRWVHRSTLEETRRVLSDRHSAKTGVGTEKS